VLFTTHRNLEAVSAALAPKLPYTCLVQGQAPRLELLRRFVAQSPAVLFATASFWQGVDVPGPALSAVIVDKLPFAPPDDPLVAARVRRLEEEGHSGFFHLMLPEAVLSLKQGLGRLLRGADDRGLLAVLDVRLAEKGYGRVFQKALAPIPLTRSREDVAAFFGRGQG
jgi:ATP-dependent DNA helicase DinG